MWNGDIFMANPWILRTERICKGALFLRLDALEKNWSRSKRRSDSAEREVRRKSEELGDTCSILSAGALM